MTNYRHVYWGADKKSFITLRNREYYIRNNSEKVSTFEF